MNPENRRDEVRERERRSHTKGGMKPENRRDEDRERER